MLGTKEWTHQKMDSTFSEAPTSAMPDDMIISGCGGGGGGGGSRRNQQNVRTFVQVPTKEEAARMGIGANKPPLLNIKYPYIKSYIAYQVIKGTNFTGGRS